MTISKEGRKIWQSKGGLSLLEAMMNGTAEQEVVSNPEAAKALKELKKSPDDQNNNEYQQDLFSEDLPSI
jgi:hypothetical protein